MKQRLFHVLRLSLLITASLEADPTANSLNSGLRIIPDGSNPNHFTANWFGIDENVYFLEQSSDLVNWSWIPVYGLGEDDTLALDVATNADRFFLRVRYSNDPNSDLLSSIYNQGGISAWNQVQLGYNPFEWVDTVSNGIHDAWEMFYFQTTGIDPLGDPNEDGLLNIDEFRYGLDPLLDEAEQVGSRENFGYDPVGRLTSFSSTMAADEYDEEGNINGEVQ